MLLVYQRISCSKKVISFIELFGKQTHLGLISHFAKKKKKKRHCTPFLDLCVCVIPQCKTSLDN